MSERPVFTGRPIAPPPHLTIETYQPNGNTALLDALGRAITEADSRFRAMSEADRPGKVIIVVVTDGQENSSQTWTKEQIKEAVKYCDDAVLVESDMGPPMSESPPGPGNEMQRDQERASETNAVFTMTASFKYIDQ